MARKNHRKSTPKILDVNLPELFSLVERTKDAMLNEDERSKLKAAMSTLAFVLEELKSQKTSITRLQEMLFGGSTEQTSRVLGKEKTSETTELGKAKQPGHGRRAAAAYTGAEKVVVPHPSLHAGECCLECARGKIYPLLEPATLVRITGMAPLGATVWECERWRCNLCGEVYTAKAPEGVGSKKYDETATGMVGLLKYGCGLPFNRIQKLQEGLGIPLPAATQWELALEGGKLLEPAFEELVRQAAQGEVLHNDDTTVKILNLTAEQREAASADSATEDRTGIFTTGIISICGDKPISLFFTGVKHAGENLADVLSKRAKELTAPIQMCDALAVNTAGDFESILGHCNSHARRNFVKVVDSFPDECRYVLETFRDLYKRDAEAKTQKLSAQERLAFHQTHSGPLMDSFQKWMKQQFADHLVEPNSGLGEAIRHMQKHWAKLTLFLQQAGAPLDNNICERALKKAILHRKNSLFYKTINGARIGDIFMSLIHTAELRGINPFHYLVALLQRHDELLKNPADWMPWNYQQTMARLDSMDVRVS